MADSYNRAKKQGDVLPTRGKFKAVNTLSSQQTPSFKTSQPLFAFNTPSLSAISEGGSTISSAGGLWDSSKGFRFSPPPSAAQQSRQEESPAPTFKVPQATFDVKIAEAQPSKSAGSKQYQLPSSTFDSESSPPSTATSTGDKAYRTARGNYIESDMVSERDPSRTSSGAYLSPQKQEARQPLANISAKMQSPSSKQSPAVPDVNEPPSKPAQPQFGQASPLRNPLHQRPRADPFFVPRARPMAQRPPESHKYSSQASAPLVGGSAHYPPPEQRGFYLPGQVPQPMNSPNFTTQPAPRPIFSSIGPNTTYQPFVPPKQVIDLTRNDDDEDDFDPDAGLRAANNSFGAADPYMYVDSAKANEDIKNLLEGAFDDDDEDKPKVRLRTRAGKRAEKEADTQAKGLAAKLAALDVKDAEANKKDLEAGEEDEEDGTVDGLTVKLLPHQVEGVGWMLDKEKGKPKPKGVMPYGGILADDMGLGKTVQSIALLLTNPRPGADAKPEHTKQKMPGKEVSKCTLVVAPLALIKQWEGEIKSKVTRSHAMKVLVHHGPNRTKSAAELKKYDVVITTYQILASEHAGSNMEKPEGLKVGCFGVHWYRLILDEAHTIKNRNAKSTLACYALNSWYRWCLTGTPMQNNLDELQSLIKFLRVKPYCELPQWKTAITGPMKNGRGGIAMRRLQWFLRMFMKRRTKDILKKDGALNFGGKSNKEGEPKKGGMQIVKREVVTMECEFNSAESEFYDRLAAKAESRLHDIEKSGKSDYIGALVILLRLRQACNHPRLIEMAMNKDKDALTTGTTQPGSQTPRKMSKVDKDDMDDLAALMGGVSVQSKNCDVCQIELSTTEVKDGAVRCDDCEGALRALHGKPESKKKAKKVSESSLKAEKTRAAPARRNRKVLEDSDDEDDDEGEWIANGPERHIDYGKAGGTDDEDAEGGGETLGSIDSASGDEEEVNSPSRARRLQRTPEASEDEFEDEDEPSEDSETSDSDTPILSGLAPFHKASHKPSTKIRHLLRILHSETPVHKTIVFSQFTSMLDLIEPHIKVNNIRFVRYDGSMKPDAREASLASLRDDPKTRVLLCSLKCGSLGLNLTAASRVVIVEPFWNPFVEEQAIDRVHRLNQTVDVKVFRLTVRNTVEEKILALQERKRELAKAAIEGGKNNVGKLTLQDILGLFHRDGGETTAEDVAFSQKFGGDARLIDGGGHREVKETAKQGGVSGERVRKGVAQPRRQEHEVFGRRW